MSNRRSFIKQSGILTAGLMMNPSGLMKPATGIGIQLYTLRNEIGNDPNTILSKIAAAGYKKVETYGYGAGKFFGKTPAEFAGLLKDNNLKSPSGHYGIDKFLLQNGNGDDVKELIDVAHTLGQEYIVIPHLSEEARKTSDQFRKLVERMNKAGELCKAGGVSLGYHNHDFEFKQLDNGTCYDILLKDADPKLVNLEMDIYWVVRAGYDPIELITKYPGRFPMWHVKDMSKTNPAENTEVGNGSIDYTKIFAVAKLSGLKHFYMEQENNYVPNALESIITSAKYISKKLV
jgi:sugar phosphate isomerase/epimerase